MSLLAEIVASGNATAPLDNPVVLNNAGDGDNQAATTTTYTSSSVSPTSGAAILIAFRTRHTAAKVHDTPTTTGLTNLGSITLVNEIEQGEADGSPLVHTSIWKAKFTGAAGTGTVTCTTGGNTFAQGIEIINLGTHTTSGIALQSAVNGLDETVAGGTISATLGAAPKSDSVVLQFGSVIGVQATHTQETGFTKLTDGQNGTEWMTAFKNGSGPTTAGMSVTSGKVRTMIVVEIAHQN